MELRPPVWRSRSGPRGAVRRPSHWTACPTMHCRTVETLWCSAVVLCTLSEWASLTAYSHADLSTWEFSMMMNRVCVCVCGSRFPQNRPPPEEV